MKKILWALIALIFILPLVWYLFSPLFIIIELDESLPAVDSKSEAVAMLNGDFIPSAHEVSGRALIIDTPEGKVLRFEDFETVNGPDLFIYLSSDLNNNDFVNLGEIKATKGNVNYLLPKDIDLKKYNKVVVWCRAFRVLFSYAELK